MPPENILALLSQFNGVDVIINAAAYTSVDQAEEDRVTAYAINAVAPGVIAGYCKANKIPIVQVSTDYVFNGKTKTPYNPEDIANPIGVYGASKYKGELAVKASGCDYAILRTSWVYDATSKNFMTTMLHLAASHDELNVVHDQVGRPTYAGDLARACIVCAIKLLEDASYYAGTYHVSGTGEPVSWADFAREIFQAARPYFQKEVIVNNILSVDYPTNVKRPSYSVLNTQSFEDTFNIQLSEWYPSLYFAVKQWNENKPANL